jgi:hypothetical protein
MRNCGPAAEADAVITVQSSTRITPAYGVSTLNPSGRVLFTFYNFCPVHKSLRMTPAMAGGNRGSYLERAGNPGGRVIEYQPAFQHPPPGNGPEQSGLFLR